MEQLTSLARISGQQNTYVPVPENFFRTTAVDDGEPRLVNGMSVDVEDYFQVSAFDDYISRDDWDSYPCRVEKNVDRILALFSDANVKGTFFILGWIAQRYPDMVRRIANAGHEIASHGWMHYRVRNQEHHEFGADILKTRLLLEDISGVEVKGYRAASYSVDETTPWAHEELLKAGYRYSSSVVPIKHDHYGIPDAPRFPFHVNPSGMLEIPVSTFKLGKSNKACGGGGWFRLYPYALSRYALRHINNVEKRPCVFYFHPWEIDPDQPRVKGISASKKFRHYVNLNRVERKLQALLKDFKWGRMDEIYLPNDEQYADSSLYSSVPVLEVET